jgi:DNA-binding response OmpR family regulator
MLSRRLARKGYEVAIAVDGQQGIDMARPQTPDLILSSRGCWTRSRCF